jgi:phosphate starvation-inducible PhoH-like protein
LSKQRGAKAQRKMTIVENTIQFHTNPKTRRTPTIIPKTVNQENFYLDLIDSNKNIVIAAGPAGTGKTYLAMQAAVQNLQNGGCDKIILTRPAVTVDDEQHGFLPGNLFNKMEPWTRPLLDVLREYYRPQDILSMIEDQIIEISPLAYMRGRTFKDSWIIADEMQNSSPTQMKMLLSRIGIGSKIIVTGDIEQTDKTCGENGLLDIINKLKKMPVKGISVCEFNGRDIQRHPIIGQILKLYIS